MRVNSISVKDMFSANNKKQNVSNERSKNNVSVLTLGTALVDVFVSGPIAKQIIKSTKTQKSFMFVSSAVGLGILALGYAGAKIFDAYDKKQPTKLGDFCQKIMNGPSSK